MSEQHSLSHALSHEQARAYWRRNLALVGKLLVVWFAVSFGCGILLVDWLNQFSVGGFKLGFWFAQQGAIYVFVGLIFYYARKMDQLDRAFNVEEAHRPTPPATTTDTQATPATTIPSTTPPTIPTPTPTDRETS